MMPMMCKHCVRNKAVRPRGLCSRCHCDLTVRVLYPSAASSRRRGAPDFCRAAPLAPRPTLAAPGTPEKVAVLCWRVAAGFAAFHPGDCKAGE